MVAMCSYFCNTGKKTGGLVTHNLKVLSVRQKISYSKSNQWDLILIRSMGFNQDGLTLNGKHQLLAYADDVNILGGRKMQKL
jgi:hypothetical protein